MISFNFWSNVLAGLIASTIFATFIWLIAVRKNPNKFLEDTQSFGSDLAQDIGQSAMYSAASLWTVIFGIGSFLTARATKEGSMKLGTNYAVFLLMLVLLLLLWAVAFSGYFEDREEIGTSSLR